MSEAKKFVLDVGVTFLASGIKLLLGFSTTMFLGRLLGASDLGLYRMTNTILSLSLMFATIGIPAAITKYAAESDGNRDKISEIIFSGITIAFLGGAVFSLLLYLSSGILSNIFGMPELSSLLKIISPIYPFTLVGGILLGALNGLREMKKHGTYLILQALALLTAIVPLIYLGFGVKGAVIGTVFSSMVACAYILWISRSYVKIKLDHYKQRTKNLIRFGVQYSTAGIVNDLNNQLDVLLIGFFLLSTDVGNYAVAVSLSRFFWLIPASIQKITYPATSTYWNSNNQLALNNMIDKCMKYCTAALLPIGLFVGFFSKEIVLLIFHGEFVDAVLPLQILLIGTVIRGGIIQPVGGSLGGIGRPDLILKISAFMLVVNGTLDMLLIPEIGIAGAAIATSISLIGAALLNLYLITKKLSVKLDYEWFFKIFSVAFFAIITYHLGSKIINMYFLGGVVILGYLAVMYNYFFSENELSRLKSLVNSVVNKR